MLPPTTSTTLRAVNNYKQNHKERLEDFIEKNKKQTEKEREHYQQQQEHQRQRHSQRQRQRHYQQEQVFYKRHQVRNHFKTKFNETLAAYLRTQLKDYSAHYSLKANTDISTNTAQGIDLSIASMNATTNDSHNSHYNVINAVDVTEYIDSVTTINDTLHHRLNASSMITNKLDINTIITSDTTATTTTTTIRTFPSAQTVATVMTGNKNRPTTIIIYPTVSPESIVIPIISCIFGFPILALIVICCLRHRAKMARERDRRRNYEDHAVSLVRFSPIHRLNQRSSRAVSLRPERSLSQGFTSLDLDTVVEERSDIEQTQTETLNPESPLESTSCRISFSGS